MVSAIETMVDTTISVWPCGNMAKTSIILPTRPKLLTSRALLALNEEHRVSVLAVGIVTNPETETGSAAPAVLLATVIWSVRSICISLHMVLK
jgi:hypothetical protein